MRPRSTDAGDRGAGVARRPRRPECDDNPLEADRGGQDLDATVDLVRAERDDAIGRGGLLRRAQRVDSACEGASEQPEVSSRRPEALAFEARTRAPINCPARAVGVMSSQTRLAISDRRSPAQKRQRHDRGGAAARASGSPRTPAATGARGFPPLGRRGKIYRALR